MSLPLHDCPYPDHGAVRGPCHASPLTVWSRHTSIFTLGLVTAISGCTLANQLNPLAGMSGLLPTQPPPDSVVGPDSTFTVRTPELIKPQGKVSTQRTETGAWSATFFDRMCSALVVTVTTDSSSTSLEERVRARARPAFENGGAVELIQRTDTLGTLGEAIFVQYRLPKGAPCEVQQISGGLMMFAKVKRPDAEVAHYLFQRGSQVFDARYIRAISEPSAGGQGADVVLRGFVTGITFAR